MHTQAGKVPFFISLASCYIAETLLLLVLQLKPTSNITFFAASGKKLRNFMTSREKTLFFLNRRRVLCQKAQKRQTSDCHNHHQQNISIIIIVLQPEGVTLLMFVPYGVLNI